MYYPYFRGKQNELITIRECAGLLAQSNFVPIVEPVKNTFSGLQRAISEVVTANGQIIIIANPQYGELTTKFEPLHDFLRSEFNNSSNIRIGILLRESTPLSYITEFCKYYLGYKFAFIHAGIPNGKQVHTEVQKCSEAIHIFIEEKCSKLYMRNFAGYDRVLVRDCFNKVNNANYPPVELFSDLHITYEDENVEGFGDFLTMQNEYSESGGPAYAVAIHITAIDRQGEEEMLVYHFISQSNSTPTDPAGKFSEALNLLIVECNRTGTNIERTKAIDEFYDLYNRGHFPGLGYVKKLSMKHHLETLSNYLE